MYLSRVRTSSAGSTIALDFSVTLSRLSQNKRQIIQIKN